MSATHKIPQIELDGVGEDGFVCYPRRGDSLCLYSNLYDSRFSFGKGRFEITPDEAAQYMGKRLGIEPSRETDRIAYRNRLTDKYVIERADVVPERVFPLPGRGPGPLHDIFSEFFTWDEPPLFRQFLRVDVSKGELRVRCFAVTGCPEHEENPPLEDEVSIRLDA